ncbi:MAG TPA: P1 family peptidase [Candidatus Dormibacteraeota bacterium]|nr:P1 family peptidase [Candidatus Dormibacteraeota bacterium]
MAPDERRGRIREFGLAVGTLRTGAHNAITDVPGVSVGLRTVVRGEQGTGEPVVRSGVTAVFPHPGDLFRERVYGAVSVFNGYGEVTSNIVMDEWGLIGSPIVITDTTHIGLGYDSVSRWMADRDPVVGTIDVVIPVVAECDDGFLNDNRAFGLAREDFYAALDGATDGPVAEGSVGAATGTQQFDFKGGTGTSSRVLELKGETFTVGVLVNTNYANRHQLQILGVPIGRLITDLMPSTHHEGSCIAVVATDAPLHPRQLRRLARRVDVGLARTGSVGNDGSGEIFIAFSTRNRIPRETPRLGHPVEVLAEGQFWTQGSPIDRLFEAVADATEEAALNALFAATTVEGRDGNTLHALPIGRTLDQLRAWRVL